MSQCVKYKTYINSLDKDELTNFVKIMNKSEIKTCSEYMKSVNRMTDYDYIDNLINKRLIDVTIHTINMLKLGIIKLNELENLEKIYFNTHNMSMIIEAIKNKIMLRQILLEHIQDENYDFDNKNSYNKLKIILSKKCTNLPMPSQSEIKLIMNSIDFNQFIIKISPDIIDPFLNYVKHHKIIFNNVESENIAKFTEYQEYMTQKYALTKIPEYEDYKHIITKIYNYTSKLKPHY
jgi:hypothetical protein